MCFFGADVGNYLSCDMKKCSLSYVGDSSQGVYIAFSSYFCSMVEILLCCIGLSYLVGFVAISQSSNLPIFQSSVDLRGKMFC